MRPPLLSGAGNIWALSIPEIIEWGGNSVYLFQALLAIWGIYNVILLYRGLNRKSIEPQHEKALFADLEDLCLKALPPKFEEAQALCRKPPYWHTALAQLIGLGLNVSEHGLAKVKQSLALEFHTAVISGLESRVSSLVTAAKLSTLLGLLGTVLGMIAAFGRMGEGEKADPSSLAGAISLALWTTAIGLIVASPLLIFANDIQNRLRGLRDQTERQLARFIDILEKISMRGSTPQARAVPHK